MWLHWAKTVANAGLQFIYPPTCLWCGCLLPESAPRLTRFCEPCLGKITPAGADRCQRCSAPVGPHLNTEHGCIHCPREKMRFSGVVSLGAYQDELRAACLKCKHPGQFTLASALAGLMCRQNEQLLRSWKADLIMPVPHDWFQRMRSDQAVHAIAEATGKFLKVPVELNLLKKVRRTKKQQSLPASSRRSNLRAAFRVSQIRRIQGRTVLLVDDVLTTGITADSCAQVLLKAGAKRVDVAVVARSIGS